jgi:hypothetical protein
MSNYKTLPGTGFVTFSLIASARSNSGRAAESWPWSSSRMARLLRLIAVSGWSGRLASAAQYQAETRHDHLRRHRSMALATTEPVNRN